MGSWFETCRLTNMPIFPGDQCTAIFIDMRSERIIERLGMVSGVHALIQRVAISALRQAEKEQLPGDTTIDHEMHDIKWEVPDAIIINGGYDEYGMSTKLPSESPGWSEVYDYRRAYFHRRPLNAALKFSKLFTESQYEFAKRNPANSKVWALMKAADLSAFCMMARLINPWEGRLIAPQYYDANHMEAVRVLRKVTDEQWAHTKREMVRRR